MVSIKTQPKKQSNEPTYVREDTVIGNTPYHVTEEGHWDGGFWVPETKYEKVKDMWDF